MRSKIGAGERDEQAARVYGSTFTVLPCWFRRRSRGWARNGRAVKALPYGAADEGTGWRCLLCVCPGPDRRGAHTSQKGATCAPPRGNVNDFRERSHNVGG